MCSVVLHEVQGGFLIVLRVGIDDLLGDTPDLLPTARLHSYRRRPEGGVGVDGRG